MFLLSFLQIFSTPSYSSGVAQWLTVLCLYKQLPGVTVCLTVNVKQGFTEKQHESPFLPKLTGKSLFASFKVILLKIWWILYVSLSF